MNFDILTDHLAQTGLNLYDLAVYTPNGTLTHHFQPANRCNDFYSVAKAFITTAVGLLWDEGKIKLDDRIADIFEGEMPQNADPLWQTATVEHALTHGLGLPRSFLDIDVDDATLYPTDDFLLHTLSQKLEFTPGERSQYSDGTFYLLGRAVHRITGEKVNDYLQRKLFCRLRFREVAWSLCPAGHPIGGSGLYLSCEDAVKLGAVYMQNGLWKGERLLSEDWIATCLQKGFEFHPSAIPTFFGKGGMNGQMLMFSKEKQIAVCIHAYETRSVYEELVKGLEKAGV